MSESENNIEISYEELFERSRRMRKRVLIVCLCCFLSIALLVGGFFLIRFLLKPPQEDFGNYYFYPPYEGDIMENSDYLEKNRQFCYCADPDGLGVTYPLNEAELKKLDSSVNFVCQYLQAVINGDVTAYNAMLSTEYVEKNGYQAAFNPQMIYNVTIYEYESQTLADGAKVITYKLDYMIYRNDGTFRQDMGSDAIRSQFIVLNCATDGSITVKDLISFRIDSYQGQEN